MKKYRVVVTTEAQHDIRRYLAYLREKKQNPQAAQNVWDDYKQTRVMLGKVADTIKDSDSQKLRQRGLKRINFRTHGYFLLFRTLSDRVEVVSVFHESEDFESKLR